MRLQSGVQLGLISAVRVYYTARQQPYITACGQFMDAGFLNDALSAELTIRLQYLYLEIE
jgi:hypothetical protein